jgi:hypothetical protein
MLAYDAGMADDGPWERYDRDKLPKGWAYPLGRDEVRAALVAAGVRLGSLSFSRSYPNESAGICVLQVFWPSDSRAKYFGSRDPDISPLTMSVGAVPSELRNHIGQQLRRDWLERAVVWAHQAPNRGNVWTATDHWWSLMHKPDDRLILEDT